LKVVGVRASEIELGEKKMKVGVGVVESVQGEGYRGSGSKSCKERGQWAELCFMVRAAEQKLKVSKPWGEPSSYDVGVEYRGRFLRVQVESTI
jgi:PD-(D/E)XK endonuclease